MKLKNWFWEILEKSVRDATSMVCFCLFGKKRSRIMGFLSKIQKKVGPLNFNASGPSVSHLLYYLLNFSRYVLLQIYIRNADISKRCCSSDEHWKQRCKNKGNVFKIVLNCEIGSCATMNFHFTKVKITKE